MNASATTSNHTLLLKKPEQAYSYRRAPIYTITFILGCLFTVYLFWAGITYVVPFERRCIHTSSCGCMLDVRGRVLLQGTEQSDMPNCWEAPISRHWRKFKKILTRKEVM